MENKVRILHIIKDDKKFFNSVISCFDSDDRLHNDCVLIVNNEKDAFQSIERTSRVTVLSCKQQVKEMLLSDGYDIIFFYSLPYDLWYIFDYIPQNRVVIWWSWGYELYEPIRGMKPILPLNLYKRETQKIACKPHGFFSKFAYFVKLLLRPYYLRKRNKVLRRIDYYQPVIRSEYFELLDRYPTFFRAKEFYYKDSWTASANNKTTYIDHSCHTSILLGNSSSHTNNHVDVWKDIKSKIAADQTVIIPLNYGDKEYAKIVKKSIQSSNCMYLDTFMEKDKYFALLESCSYFVSGILRQQAVGNILYCISHGIKIFLYRDSMMYKYLNLSGVAVYAIEDLSKDSFNNPTPQEEFISNMRALNNEINRRNSIYENFMSDITFK